jgi:arylsulfatase A-like enzyme
MKLDYAVVLTADHGVEDLAERVGVQRADPALSAKAVGAQVAKTLGIDGPVLAGGIGGDVYLDPALTGAQRAKAESEALRIFRSHPQVEAAFTRAELEKTPLPTDSPARWTLLQRARASFDATRSGDFIVLLKKGVSLLSKPDKGDVATHGSPWDYDRRVPILFWRAGMAPQNREEAIDTTAIMPTIAAMIGVSVDRASIDGRCLGGISEIACPTP